MTSLLLLMQSTIKVSSIVLVALGATSMLRNRRSAAVRHWVLSAAIVCAAATPFLELVVPSWHLRVSSPSVEPRAAWAAEVGAAGGQTTPRPGSGEFAKDEHRDAAQSTGAYVLGTVWLAGIGICLSILIVGLLRLASIASTSEPVADRKWTGMADHIARECGLRRPVQLLQSEHPTLLVTWGLLRPKVILPPSAREWTEDRVRVVLAHEFAHIRRGDWMLQMAGELLRSVYWFNPLLWIACTRLRQESERACDDAVLSSGVEGPDYATHLLDLARALAIERRIPDRGFPAPAIVRRSSLERRITAMLDSRLNRNPITRSGRVATAIALAAITLSVAGFAAQPSFATLSGLVSDESGAMVPDAKLVVTHIQSRAKHEVRSNEAGYFEFVGLPAGEYLFESQFPGFAPLQDTLMLSARQTMQRNVALQLGSVEETITVRHSASGAESPRKAPRRGPAAAKPCSASPIGGRIQPPLKLDDVKPEYPVNLRDASVEGQVLMEGRIGTDGFIRELRVVEAMQPDLADAAVAAVTRWRFAPTRLNCNPVETNIQVRVNFTVER